MIYYEKVPSFWFLRQSLPHTRIIAQMEKMPNLIWRLQLSIFSKVF